MLEVLFVEVLLLYFMSHLAVDLSPLVFVEVVADDPFRKDPLEGERASAVDLDGDLALEQSIAELGVLGVQGEVGPETGEQAGEDQVFVARRIPDLFFAHLPHLRADQIQLDFPLLFQDQTDLFLVIGDFAKTLVVQEIL